MKCSKSGEGFDSCEMAVDPIVVVDLQYLTNVGTLGADPILVVWNAILDGEEWEESLGTCRLDRALR